MARRSRGSILLRGRTYFIKYSLLGRARMERAGASIADAQRLLTERLAEMDQGVYRLDRVVLFDGFMDRFWTDHVECSGLKPSTRSAYASVIRRHLLPWFGRMRMDRITPGLIQRFVAETLLRPSDATGRMLAPKTFRNTLRILSKIFSCAVDWRVIARSPVQRITLPRVEHREMDFLRPLEVQRLLEAAPNEETRCLFLVAIFTGLRQGELLALEWRHVDVEGRTIRVRQSFSRGEILTPKTRSSMRDVRLGANVAAALAAHKSHVADRSAFVFSNGEGKPLDGPNVAKRIFHPSLQRAGLRRIRWHDLRHSYASLMLNEGCNVKYLSAQMGHASAQITLDRYAHLIPERHDATVDAVDALAAFSSQLGDSRKTAVKTSVTDELRADASSREEVR